MKKLFALALAFAATLASPVFAQLAPVEPLERIVAIVDEDVVLQSELDASLNAIRAQYANNPQQLPPRDVLERQVLERLVLMKLQVSRAEQTGIKISDAELEATLSQIARQNRMDLGQLRIAAQQQGTSWEQFRQNLREELLVQRLRQRVVQSRVQVSDTEVDLLLKNGGVERGQLHLGHILVSIPDGATPAQIETAHDKVVDVRRQIEGGMDFAAAAIRFSDAQNALDGGDLGWRGYDEIPPAFSEAASKLQEGQVSEPLRGPSGFHLVKLIGKREAAPQLVTEYHARHIMIRTTEVVSADQAQRSVENIRKRIVAGEDFAKLAKEFSEDPNSATLGGDMGWFPADAYGTRVAETVTKLREGELSDAFQTEAGWHLIELLGKREQDRTEEVERAQARQTLGNRKADEEYERFLRELRAEAYIDYRLPGAQAGASGRSP